MSGAVLLPIYILVFVALIYFIGIRPQQRRKKELDALLSTLGPGDEVMTAAGIYGVISEIEDGDTLTLQVAEDVDIRVARSSIARKISGQVSAPAEGGRAAS